MKWLAVALAVSLLGAILIVACVPGGGPPGGAGTVVEIDVDAPKKHKAPKYGKRR